MIRIRSHVALKQRSGTELEVRSNPTRRVLFGVVAILLVLAVVIGADWDNDFGRDHLVGNIFFFLLTGAAAVIAGWSSSMIVDVGERNTIRFAGTLFGIPIRVDTMDPRTVKAVVLQGVKLLRESETPRVGLGSPRLAGYLARRTTYYKLYLETNEARRLVEDSTDLSELDAIGVAVARLLDVEYRKEDV